MSRPPSTTTSTDGDGGENGRESADREAARRERMVRSQLRDRGYTNVEVRVGDGAAGAPDRAPFGGISVTASAPSGPPAELVEQLAPGAALVCPIRHDHSEELMRFRDGRAEAVVPVRFVPLV